MRPAVTAECFRQLTARLKSGTPRQAEPAMTVAAPVGTPDPQPQPEAVSAPPPDMIAVPPPQDLPRPLRDAAEEAGDTAISLVELMATAAGLLPQERALAADALLLLLPRLDARQLARLAERVAIMDNPPPLVVAKLIRDPRPEVMGPVLERTAHLGEREMIAAVPVTDLPRLAFIAHRRVLPPALSGYLIASGDPGIILSVLRNPQAELPHDAFPRLAVIAASHPALLTPLATRADLPAATAFALYWDLSSELRRLIVSRFLTDSETLSRLLRMALGADGGGAAGSLREERPAPAEAFEQALETAARGELDEAAERFAALAGISSATALRIITDSLGEPAAVLFKALGVSRARFAEVLKGLSESGAFEGNTEALQGAFDALSFTKARVLLTYWDWLTRKMGPYAQGE